MPRAWRVLVSTCAVLPALMAGGRLSGQAPPQKFVPSVIKASDLVVRLEQAGSMPVKANPTSPVVAGADLLLVDQGGYLYRWDGTTAHELFTPKNVPPGISLLGFEPLLNVAANAAGSKVYLVVISSRVPKDIPQRRSPREPDSWYVVYEYDFDRATLSRPRPLVAFGARSEGHTGGGLIVLEDGSLLFAVGDNGDSYEDGRDHPQVLDNHLGKIVRIGADGAVKVIARGVRNCQRLVVSGAGEEARLHFIDDGGWVAEELDSVSVKELLSSANVANFGWGRNREDKKAREGTLYVDSLGNAIGRITDVEPGYSPPVADFGREAAAVFGASGPVVGGRSFSRITALFGDLESGAVFATTRPLANIQQDVFHVRLVNAQQRPITLRELAGGKRPDPRFFVFPDGSAGVLLEGTGQFYRLDEVRTVQ